MAGGFNASAFTLGLLGNINAQREAEQKRENELKFFQDKELIIQRRMQAQEYDKKKAAEESRKAAIEDLATSLASRGNNGQGYPVDADARKVAQYVIDNKFNARPELDDWIMDGYEKTHKHMMDNPQLWGKQTDQPLSGAAIQPSTAPQTPQIGQSGVKFGSLGEDVNRRAQNRAYSAAQGRTEAASSPEALELARLKAEMKNRGQLKAFGYNDDGTPIQQGQQQPNMLTQQQGVQQPQMQAAPTQPVQQLPTPTSNVGAASPMATKEIANPAPNLPTPPTPAGISLAGNAPPEQMQGMQEPQTQPAQAQPAQMQQQQPQAAPQQPQLSATAQRWKQLYTVPQSLQEENTQKYGVPERQWSALDRLTDNDKSLVIKMSNGEMPIPSVASGRGAQAAHNSILIGALNEFDPSANAQRFDSQKKFLTGKNSVTIAAVNTSMSHMRNLMDAYESLDAGDIPTFNKIRMAYERETGKPAPSNYEGIRAYLAEELRKVYVQSGSGSLEELRQIEKTIEPYKSQAQGHAMFRSITDMLDGRINSLDHEYKLAKGLAYQPMDWLSPEAKSAYNRAKAYNRDGKPVDKNDNPINPKAIEYLKANPNTAGMFEQTFGVPASTFVRVK